jgi:hypothetical protein
VGRACILQAGSLCSSLGVHDVLEGKPYVPFFSEQLHSGGRRSVSCTILHPGQSPASAFPLRWSDLLQQKLARSRELVRVTYGLLLLLQGMDFTTDKLRSLVRKWQSLIEAHVDVKTTDNYTLRVFAIAFTKKRQNQIKRTCYAQTAQIRQV